MPLHSETEGCICNAGFSRAGFNTQCDVERRALRQIRHNAFAAMPALAAAVDRALRYRAYADAALLAGQFSRTVDADEHGAIEEALLESYRRCLTAFIQS